MSKTTPEEAYALSSKHGFDLHGKDLTQLAALIDEVRGVDAEPIGFRVRHLYPQGPGPWRFLDKGIAHAQEGEELQLLYTRQAPSQPAAPVELPVVAWEVVRTEGAIGYGPLRQVTLKDATAPDFWIKGRIADGYAVEALVKLSDAQAAIAAWRKV